MLNNSLTEFVFCGRIFDKENDILIVFAQDLAEAELIFKKHLIESYGYDEVEDEIEVVIEFCAELNNMRLRAIGVPPAPASI